MQRTAFMHAVFVNIKDIRTYKIIPYQHKIYQEKK